MQTLPIDVRIPEILRACETKNLVLTAEAGAGKTTRVPIALAKGGKRVWVVEPRRIAARMAARRVAQESKVSLGQDLVGYIVRHDRKVQKDTKLRFLTDGILVSELRKKDAGDIPADVVIFDEFHERRLGMDLSLALLRRAQCQGSQVRIVVMSATLATESLSEYLDALVLHVTGRTFPVEVDYLNAGEAAKRSPVESLVRSRLHQVEDKGDVLVFLPGFREMRNTQRTCAELCKKMNRDLLMLHGDLSAAEQDKAVKPGKRPKVVLSTNIAESSVTIQGVTTVIDSGLARTASVSPFSGLPTLSLSAISQASAIQRAGRAGRTQPGRCMRLYTAHDFRSRPAQEQSEISRLDVCEALLLLVRRGIPLSDFEFFESPPMASIETATALLKRLGALSVEGELTDVGEILSDLPVHPRLGRLALAGDERRVGARAVLLAALLSERDIRVGHRSSESADHVGTCDLIEQLMAFERAEIDGLSPAVLRACSLDVSGTRNVDRLRRQLARSMGCEVSPRVSLYDEEEALREAVLVAFPDRVGRRRRAKSDEVVFADGGSGQLSASSVVKEAEFLVCSRARVNAGKTWVDAATEIESDWLLSCFADEVRDKTELRYDQETDQVLEYSALLYGSVVLDESTGVSNDFAATSLVLGRAAMDAGLEKFFDADELAQLRYRIGFARQQIAELPELSEEWIQRGIAKACIGHRSLRDLKKLKSGISSLLLSDLSSDLQQKLSKVAPSFVSIPGRKQIPVHYEADRDPWIQSYLQDFFGAASGPRLGDKPLVLHLLGPNRRAVQVTTDLAGFWAGEYQTLRKPLSRRYPRHAWPEDPLSAKPSRPARRKRK